MKKVCVMGKSYMGRLLLALSAVIVLMMTCNYKASAASDKKLERPVITSVNKTKDSLAVEWSIVDNADGYELYISDNGSKYKCIAKVTDSLGNSYTIRHLRSGNKYRLKVRAYGKTSKGIIYSDFSKIKRRTTEYGLLEGYYSCKRYNISWNKKEWNHTKDKVLLKYGNLTLKTKGRYNKAAYINLSYRELYTVQKGKSLDWVASDYIKQDNRMYNSYKYVRLPNRMIGGRTFAVLQATAGFEKNSYRLICPVANDLIEINYAWGDEAPAEMRKNQIQKVLSSIRINNRKKSCL